MVKKVGIFEAKTHFSALIDEVARGTEVVVTKNGHPVARIVPIVEAEPRIFGVAKALFDAGVIKVSDDFDAPLPPDVLRKFYE